ncbi:hypothetical protein OG455_01225 [Kitasatospora sp. NBC_01287]|uniref:hypothetical protein n=1 Tax=Kitasatospora sp. NBC_01287 TaxID=2903573 RepID=UPI00224D9C21|nr:hypothetical protein [Kitasatospora sp. NBC_01287]MCX4744146.1 hypothetical protein [Kitasatospora sp. NBC_01287]
MTTRLKIFADYHQIHVMDEDSDDDLGRAWSAQAVLDGVGVADGIVLLGTVNNMHVAVTVDLLDDEPVDDSADFDHVVEAALHVPSGCLTVLGCSDYLPDAARFDVPVGWLRVRAARSGLDAAAADPRGFASEDIRLQIWPAPQREPRVLTRWTRPTA